MLVSGNAWLFNAMIRQYRLSSYSMAVINGRERRDNFEMALGNRAQLQLHRAETHGSINTWKILVICNNIVDSKINKEKLYGKYRDRIH